MRDVIRERRWLPLKKRRHHLWWCACRAVALRRRVAGEWHMAGYHFVKHHAETPDISGFINPADCGTRLFRRHITNSSQYRTQIGLSECHRSCPVRRSLGEGGFGEFCNPKVEHFHVPVRPEHDVFRFDVAM